MNNPLSLPKKHKDGQSYSYDYNKHHTDPYFARAQCASLPDSTETPVITVELPALPLAEEDGKK